MNCIVIDDEPLARQGMGLLIEEVPDLNLVGSFSSVIDADTYLRLNRVDLIFLDIQMPVMSGIDFLKVNTQRPMVVITTAYPEYALDGFDLDVVDFLTKPIRFERFYKAVVRCIKYYELINQDSVQNQSPRTGDDTLFIRSNRKYLKVNLNNISHIEALKDYIIIYCDSEKIPVSINLKAIEGKLPQGKFLRVNKSFIVNIDFIKSIEADLISLGEIEISLGDKYKDDVLKTLLEGRLIRRDY